MSIRLFQHHPSDNAKTPSDHLDPSNPELEPNQEDADEEPSNVWLFACAACLFVLWRASVMEA